MHQAPFTAAEQRSLYFQVKQNHEGGGDSHVMREQQEVFSSLEVLISLEEMPIRVHDVCVL